MSEFGERLIRGAREALAVARGEIEPARVVRVPLTARKVKTVAPPRYDSDHIRRVRSKMHLSQAVFADALNVSRETVRAWEQGKREPEGATRRLLEIAERHPEVLLDSVATKKAS